MADNQLAALRRLAHQLRVAPATRVTLPHDIDPAHTGGFVHEADAGDMLQADIQSLSHYQDRLAAQSTYGLLVVLQGLDAAGKDGTVKHVMSGVNPQGVSVRSFKVPSEDELRRDFLWRYQRELPARGTIGIFNRSHYEEVLVVRVHPENLDRERVPADARGHGMWERRFRSINDWERHLVSGGIHVTKIFLHVSRAEQRRRLLQRIDDPAKNWKFSPADLAERHFWKDYMQAGSDMLSETSTEWAPWHVVPADRKWFARVAVAAVIVDALAHIDPQFPQLDAATQAELAKARQDLLAEDG